jgi:CO/xanthine dehydrogenase Mo-binding subunit
MSRYYGVGHKNGPQKHTDQLASFSEMVKGERNTLTECFVCEKGPVFTDGLARYRMPSIMQTPAIISIIIEHPKAEGPYGAKGIGEISNMPTIPAVTNVIHNACGARVQDLFVDQDCLKADFRTAYV